MKPRAFVIAAFLVCSCQIGFAAGTPEATLEEMAFADQVDVIFQHLPASMTDSLNSLSPQEKEEAATDLLFIKKMKKEGLTIRQAGVNVWEVADDKGVVKGNVRVKNSFVSGIDAMIVLELTEFREGRDPGNQHKELAFISMQVQDGEWRITQVGSGEQRNIEEVLGHLVPGPGDNEASAVSSLRMLKAAIAAYLKANPQTGMPSNLQTLCQSRDASVQHLVDNAFASTPAIKHRYEFRYVRTGSGTYTITARPVEFGKTGTRSFFTDESGIIRYTADDREPNAGDAAL